MSEITAILGQRIKKHRVERSLSQEKLAELCDLHATYIGQVERGEKNLTVISLLKISGALKISPERLIENLGAYQNESEIDIPHKAFELFLNLEEHEAQTVWSIIEQIIKYKQN